MAMPAITKTWSHVTNQRITFLSLNDTAARLLYGLFSSSLITAGGFTCIGSSTGVTATGNMSGSNVWASSANCGVRGISTTAVQSWIVFRCGNGWDWLVAYQGAADNNIKVSASPGQLWTLNGTNPAYQPTATDEIAVASYGFDLCSSTPSLDRIWDVSWSSDRRLWRCWVLRSSTMLGFLAGEQVIPTVTAFAFSPAVCGYSSAACTSQSLTGGVVGAANGSGNNAGSTRINGTNLTLSGCGETFANSGSASVFSIEKPELHAASPIVPVGSANVTTASYKGKVGNRIDIWAAYQNTADQTADVYAGATYTGFGGNGVVPFDGSTKVIA